MRGVLKSTRLLRQPPPPLLEVIMRDKKAQWAYRLMTLPGLLCLLAFSYIPMFGIIMAFQNFIPTKGFLYSKFIGLKHFYYLFQLPDIANVFYNTLYIAFAKIVLGLIIPILFALMLNEIRSRTFLKLSQTIMYLPNFVSWVILATIFRQIFSNFGFVNAMLQALNFEPVNFLGNGGWFRTIVIWSDVWKNFGFGTIVYLASIIAINPNLYDAAKIDGASKLQQIWHVTLPGMASIIVLMATLSLGRVLSAGFDQIYNMYNPLVYSHADIIDTYVYRIGLEGMQFGFAAAVGLFQSVISCILIILSYFLAGKYANYRIF